MISYFVFAVFFMTHLVSLDKQLLHHYLPLIGPKCVAQNQDNVSRLGVMLCVFLRMRIHVSELVVMVGVFLRIRLMWRNGASCQASLRIGIMFLSWTPCMPGLLLTIRIIGFWVGRHVSFLNQNQDNMSDGFQRHGGCLAQKQNIMCRSWASYLFIGVLLRINGVVPCFRSRMCPSWVSCLVVRISDVLVMYHESSSSSH